MTANKPVDDAIIIGIDFGTTFSGVAWAYSREPDTIELVTSWDSELNHCSDVEKAPTQLYYGNDGKQVLWGYSIPTDKDALKWFKLLLLDEKDLPDGISASTQIQEARRLRTEINKDSIDIIGCFLRKIWNHTIESIKRTVSAELLQKSIFHVVITLPAIWPPYAQHRMKQAAKISGILDARSCGATTLRFISEPEAAALATMKDLSKRSTIKSGDTIVICDAGGGTVDLISYVVESTEPFVVKECVKGDGDLCGGVFLDENFINLIKTKVPSGSWNFVSKTEEKKFLNDGWEHGIKPQFENQAKIWPVDLPDGCNSNQFKGLKRRMTLDLTSREILSVFSPIVSKIEALVTRQVDAIKKKYLEPPKYIILVGGFGRSRYLFSSLQDKYGSTVLQSRGTKPWTAICRGAVVQGLTNHHLSPGIGVNVEARIARMSYGIKSQTQFDPEIHDIRDKVWSDSEQEFKAQNQMKWFLREGDNITAKRPVRNWYFRLYSGPIGQVSKTIYSSFVSPPPSRSDSSVERMCEVNWSQDVNFESLPTWTNPIGKVFHKLRYEVEMTCEDGTVDFTVYHDGVRVGGHNVEVEFN
ncbi:hypothetical protein FALBO_10812 [Fusarium albosuccineum]|uniref:Hsp70 protein n=1 Tax=Fusarium albosuccineum TaxID=1237068 RepID=A0A8H4L6B8_9HYPO|nr:hypothetical protein FALBO_10812 [Fusarium albosuccineum]